MLTFTPLDQQRLAALIDNPPLPLLADIAAATQAMYAATNAAAPWISYLAERDGAPVGSCSFKGLPQNGATEIAYFTFPGHEGQGIGKMMAAHLLKLGFAETTITELFAYTLPEENASAAILRHHGFSLLGLVEHPEDGTIWHWRLKRSDYRPS